jgi:hypothetical protein
MKSNLSVLVVFFLFNSVACINRKTSEVENIVKEWIGKHIQLPDIKPVIPYLRMKRDTVLLKPADKEYKILLYTDSMGCTKCKFKLHIWESYIKEFNSKASFLFYFHPKTEEELVFFLKNERFAYTVYIDNRNELYKLNQFPPNPMFHCFLLDRNNKVISIGNPVNNPKVWKLYKKIITGEISDKPPVTTVEPEQTKIELNDLRTGKTSEAIFVLKNTGTNPLIIQQVESSCGCTVPEWEKQPIAAGNSTEIKVKITPEKSEYFNKVITVHCNTEEGQILFIVKGMVE